MTTSNRSKRKFSWWPGDSEWLAQKVDKWLIPGNRYSKLRASISTKSCNTVVEEEPKKAKESWRPDQGGSSGAVSSEPASKLKTCLKYGEDVYKNYSDKLSGRQRTQMTVSRSFSAKEGKKTIGRQDWARSSYNLKRRNTEEDPVSFPRRESSFRSKTIQRFTSSVVPSEVIFEKCRPKPRPATLCGAEPCMNQEVPCCVQSNDIIYYPFREEDCVVCKYIFENANHFRMSVEPLQHVACSTDGCHFLYGSKSFPCNTGQIHSGCKMTPCATLVNNMSRCTLRETRISSDSPAKAFYENSFCKKTQPTININQDFIEVRYDNNMDDIANNNNEPVHDFTSSRDSESEPEVEIRRKPERPPPTYMNVIRRDNSYVRPRKCTYQHQNGEDRFYIHGSPFLNNARVPARETLYRYTNVEDNRARANPNLNGHRRTNTLPITRPNVFRETPKYRSQGRFSHAFYDTEQAVRDALEVNGNNWNNNGLRRGNSFTYHRPSPSLMADNQSPAQFQLREVNLKSSNPLRNVMSFRNSSGKSTRRKKSVVVGEDGFQGPMWPRVLLTFDRGVTPNAPTTSVGGMASVESDA